MRIRPLSKETNERTPRTEHGIFRVLRVNFLENSDKLSDQRHYAESLAPKPQDPGRPSGGSAWQTKEGRRKRLRGRAKRQPDQIQTRTLETDFTNQPTSKLRKKIAQPKKLSSADDQPRPLDPALEKA